MSTRPRESHSHPAIPQAASSGRWVVKYVRTPADARAAFGRHQKEAYHHTLTACNIGAKEPNSSAAVKFTVMCDEDGCGQAWVVPLN